MHRERFVGFDTIKRTVSISQILGRYGLMEQLQRRGDSLSGVCPIHAGHNPGQFRVSLSRNCWICFGDCQAGGSIIDFVSRKERIGVREAGLLIQQWFHVQGNGHNGDCGKEARPPIKPSTPKVPDGNKPLSFVLEGLDPEHPYLAERGLCQETIAAFGLGFCRQGCLRGLIAIPIHNEAGELIAYAGRWPGSAPKGAAKYRLPKGFKKSLELFNLHRACEEPLADPLAIVEGFFDVIKLHQNGWRKVVALMGSSMSTAQEELIRRHTLPGTPIVVMLDEDDAGKTGREDIESRLSRFRPVKVHRFETPGLQPEHLSVEEVAQLMKRQ